MMATEATYSQVDANVSDAITTVPVIETTTQHVEAGSGQLNGSLDEIENKQIADIVDELVNSAEVSVSGGSDTEASKTDVSKLRDDKGHVRSSSVKKPSSFKSVSVNKTFLAAKSAAASSKTGDKSTATIASASSQPSTPGSSGSRLKLVAKSGSSLGGSAKLTGSNGAKPAAAPDASVWKKNMPPPVPEPKKLSEQELMSQYGIHIADRLRPEDTAGANNWADIDDDEEWEPETIAWADGTKITLPQVEDSGPSHATIPISGGAPKISAGIEKPKSPAPVAPKFTASPSVKPGVLASGKGLVLKGAPEKPTLVAKPPAPPTPVKSPWATLPPVEKVSPVVLDVPVQQQQQNSSRLPPKDSYFVKAATPPPTKEIAADDFSRSSWREGGSASSRELFNSQSGRYEPVQDRRASYRGDVQGRQQPSLLQRGSHSDHPEPSAAFQTSRSSGHDGPYNRRRGSSNVSGGSGAFARTMKDYDGGAHPELLPARRSSMSGGSDGQGTSRNFSPASQPGYRNQSGPSPHLQSAKTYYATPNADSRPNATLESQPSPQIDELQKKIMRERREAAVQRRLEEEAREEAARRERIKAKLEAMGPAPERRSAKKDEEAPTPTQIQLRDAVTAQSPSAEQAAVSQDQPSKSTSESKSASDIDQNIARVSQSTTSGLEVSPAESNERIPGLSGGTATSGKWPDAPSTWVSGTKPPLRNVWAAPGNDRSLGNGTFSSDLGHLPDSQSSTSLPRPNPGPIGPIGPPGTSKVSSQGQAEHMPSAAPRIAPIGPPLRQPLTDEQRQASIKAWQNVDTIRQQDEVMMRERRAVHDAHRRDLENKGLNIGDVQATVKDNWRPVELSDGKRTTGRSTTKFVNSAADHISTAGEAHARIAQGYQQAPPVNGLYSAIGGSGGISPVPTAAHGVSGQVRSGSRFFPSRDIRLEEAAIPEHSRPGSPTPPPPTMDGHPAYDGDILHPHVALPPTRPVVKLPPAASVAPPVPVAPAKLVAPPSFAAAAAAPPPRPFGHTNAIRPPSRGQYAIGQTPGEIARQENWQDKINTLIGRKAHSPAKPMAATVDSASKSVLEHTPFHHASATVSLPALSPSSTVSSDGSTTSRQMAEECFGEQEMGSLPAVRLPNTYPDALWTPSSIDWTKLPPKYHPREVFSSGSVSVHPYRFMPENPGDKPTIRISLPGIGAAKVVDAPAAPRTRSNPRGQGTRGGRQFSRGGRRTRDSVADHGPIHGSDRNDRGDRQDRPASSRSRGGFRGRSDNWSRHASTSSPLQT